MDQVDVLVVGAGPTGLTAACEALRQGLTVAIVEQRAHRSTRSKALVVHARSLEILQVMGLAERLVEAGTTFAALHVCFAENEPVRVDLTDLDWGDTRFPFWLSLPQYETERLLEERLIELGGAVRWSCELTGLRQDEHGVEASLDDGGVERWIRARWLVAADGGRSRCRTLAGRTLSRGALHQTFVLADAKTEADLVENEGRLFQSAGGLLLLVPMPELKQWRVIAHLPDHDPNLELLIDAAFIDELVWRRAGIEFGAHDLSWTSQFQLHQGVADDYRAGRIFLAGDAAHIHSPVGGQGMNTGIQDAFGLLWRLGVAARIGEEAAEPLLAGWARERRALGSAMVRDTTRMTRLLTSGPPLLQGLLRSVGQVAIRGSGVQQLLGPRVAMLEDRVDLGRTAEGLRIQPGERIPDRELPDGRRVHELLGDRGHTALRLAPPDAEPHAHWPGGHGVWRLRLGEDEAPQKLDVRAEAALRAAFGVEHELYALVRPDRVLSAASPHLDGLLGSGADVAAVIRAQTTGWSD